MGSFDDLLRAVAEANAKHPSQERLPSQMAPGEVSPTGGIKDRIAEVGSKEASGLDLIFGGAAELGRDIGNLSGFDGRLDNLDDVLPFLASLPTGIVSAVPSGIAQVYEAATGTPVQEVDTDTGLMPDYTLTPEQRLGSAVEGGINVAGGFFGGTARLGGTIAKGLTGGKVGKKLAEGSIKGLKQIPADMAEEAAEEFVQSLASQTRYGEEWNYGDAAYAAGLGALGGGIMSGAMYGVNKVLDSESKRTRNEPPDFNSPSYAIETESWDGNALMNIGNPVTLDAAAKRRESQKVRAGGTFEGSNSSIDIGLTDIEAGIRPIIEMWYSEDSDEADPNVTGTKTRDVITQSLKLDSETDEQASAALDSLFKNQNLTEVENAMNARLAAIEAEGRHVTVAVGRNPDTKEASIFRANVKRFTNSLTIGLNSAVPTMIGADQDGDTWQIFFDTNRVNDAGYIPSRFIDHVTGKATSPDFGIDLGLERPGGKDNRTWKHSLYNPIAEILGREEFKNFRASFRDAFYSDRDNLGSADSQKMAEVFSNLRAKVLEKKLAYLERGAGLKPNKKDAKAAREYAQQQIALREKAEMETDLFISQLIVDSRIQNIESSAIYQRLSESISNALIAKFGDKAGNVENIELPVSSGRMGESFAAWIMHYALEFGLVGSPESDKGNAPFREANKLKFETDSMPYSVSANEQARKVGDTFAYAIARAFRLADLAAEPVDAIETLINELIRDQTIYMTGLDKAKLGKGVKVEEMLDVFIQVTNSFYAMYNEARNTPGFKGGIKSLTANKTPIGQDGMLDVYRAFSNIFGTKRLKDIFYMTNMGDSGEQALKDHLDDAYQSSVRSKTFMNFIDDADVRDFYSHLLDNYLTEKKAQNSTIKEMISSKPIVPEDILLVDENGHYTVAPHMIGESAARMMFLSELLGKETAIDAGYFDLGVLLSRKRGRQLMISNDDDVIASGLLSDKLEQEFAGYIYLTNAYDKSKDPIDLERAKVALVQLSDKGLLYEIIVDYTIRHGMDPGLLRFFISDDVSMQDKELAWEYLQDSYRMTKKMPLLISGLQTSDDSVAMSDFSIRLRRANSAMERARDASSEAARSMIKEVRLKMNKSYNPSEVLEALIHQATESSIGYNVMIKACAFYEARGLSSKERDKGTTPEGHSMDAQQNSLVLNGSTFSYLDSKLRVAFASFNERDLARNPAPILAVLAGKETITVVDNGPLILTDGILDQRSLYQNVMKKDPAGEKLTADEILEFLYEVPSLVGYMCNRSVAPTTGENGPGVRLRRVGTLHDALESHVLAMRENQQGIQLERAKQFIRERIFNDPLFDYSFNLLFENNVEDVSPEVFYSRVTNEVNRWINGLYKEALSWVDNPKEAETRLYASFENEVLDTYSKVISRSTYIKNNFESMGNYLEDNIKVIYQNASDSMIAASVEEILGVDKPFSRAGIVWKPDEIIFDKIEKMKQTSLAHLSIVADVLEMDLNSEINLVPSDSTRIALESKINEKDAAGNYIYSKKQREDATAALSKTFLVKNLLPNIDEGPRITDADRNIKSGETVVERDARLKSKVEFILDPANKYSSLVDWDEYRNGVSLDFGKITGSDTEWRNFKNTYNNKVTYALLRDNTVTDKEAKNLNLERDVRKVNEWKVNVLQDIVKAVHNGEISISDITVDERSAIQNTVLPSYNNAALAENAVYAHRAHAMAEGGVVGAAVGVDGSLFQYLGGLCYLQNLPPRDIEPMPRSEMITLYESNVINDGTPYRIGETQLRWIDNKTIQQWKIELYRGGDDTPVYVYREGECLQQPCREYSPAPKNPSANANQPYVLSELVRMLAFAQEHMILKRKKRKGDSDTIVDILCFEPDFGSKRYTNISDVSTAMKELGKFRREYAKYLQGVFNDEVTLKDGSIAKDPLGFGTTDPQTPGPQARVLSEFMTPTIRLIFNEAVNGRKEQHVSIVQLNDPSFDIDWGNVGEVRLEVTPLQTISAKLTHAMSAARGDKGSLHRDDLAAASLALTDWSDYRSGEIDMKTFLGRIYAIAENPFDNIPVSSSPTALMNIMSQIKKEADEKRYDKGVLPPSELLEVAKELRERHSLPGLLFYADIDTPGRGGLELENIADFSRGFKGLKSLVTDPAYNYPGAECCALVYTEDEGRLRQLAEAAKRKSITLIVNQSAPFNETDSIYGKRSIAYQNKTSVTIGGTRFWVLDYSDTLLAENLDMGADPVSFYREPNDASPLLAVSVPREFMGQAESSIVYNPEPGKEIYTTYANSATINIRDMFKKKKGGTFKILAKNDMIDFIKRSQGQDLENVFLFEDDYRKSGYGIDRAKSAAEAFLSMSTGDYDRYGSDGLLTGKVKIGDCIGVASHVDAFGTTTYSPIILHQSYMPVQSPHIFYTGPASDGIIQFDLSLTAEIDTIEAWKSALAGSAVKASGNKRYLIGGVWVEFPQDNAPDIYAVVDAQSTENKTQGFESLNFLQILFAVSDQQTVGRNLFYDETEPGKWEKKKWFTQNLTVEQQNQLMSLVSTQDNPMINSMASGVGYTGDSALDQILTTLAQLAIKRRVPFYYLVSNTIIDENGKASRFQVNGTWRYLLNKISDEEKLILFNAMNPKLVPREVPPIGQPEYDGKTLLDYKGRAWLSFAKPGGNGETELVPCQVMARGIEALDDRTAFRQASGTASMSAQHQVIRALESGIIDSDLDAVLNYSLFKLGDQGQYARDMEFYAERALNEDRYGYIPIEEYSPHGLDVDPPIETEALRAHLKDIDNVAKTFERLYLVEDEKGDAIYPDRNDPTNRASIALQRLNDVLKLKEPIKWIELLNMHCADIGHTFLDGKGDNKLYIKYIEDTVDDLIRNLENPSTKYYLSAKQKSSGSSFRYTIPLFTRNINMRLAESQIVKDKFMDGEDAYEGMLEGSKAEIATAHRNIAHIENPRKQKALGDMLEYLERVNGLPVSANWLAAKSSFHTIFGRSNKFIEAMYPQQAALVKEYNERFLREAAKAVAREEINKGRYHSEIESENSQHGTAANGNRKQNSPLMVFAGWLESISKIMALLSPYIGAVNVTYRGGRQTLTEMILRTGAIGGKYDVPYDILKLIDGDTAMRKAFTTMRLAMIDGSEFELMKNLKNGNDISNFLDRRNAEKGQLKRIEEGIYGVVTGGNAFQKQSIRIFWDIFMRRAANEGYNELFADSGNGEPILHAKLKADPAKVFIELLSPDSAYRTLAMQCLQEARTGDLAQDNIGAEVIKYIVRDRPFWRFLQTTGVVRFPQYSFNILGNMAQFISPISSVSYLATRYLQGKQAQGIDKINQGGKASDLSTTEKFAVDIDADRLQVRASLEEAMRVDAMWMSGTALVAILVQAIPGLLEPPEDKDKWCNPDEWTVFGFRVGEEWWMQDILGMHLHAAIAVKAAMLGRPQPHILINGITRASYSNPMLRLADMVNFLADDPVDTFLEDFNQEVDSYGSARGGEPSALDVVTSKLGAGGISYLTQFFLPSVLKELYQDIQPYEASYKRIYEEDETGHLTEAGAAGKTQRTSYRDAQMRKLAKNNPAAAIIFDMFNGTETPYWAPEQPRVVYSDPTQMESVIKYSLKNEDGTDKTDVEKQAIFADIFCILTSTEDMEALYQSGFMISGATRYFVGQQLWDCYQGEIDRWNDFVKETGLDANVLGNGDWAEGMKVKTELYEEHKRILDFYSSIYYDKLNSEQMKRGVAKYNMYNTTFAVDANGEAYATGLRPTVFPNPLPFMTAPGTTSDPEGTMGWAGDWATPSSVNPDQSTGIRALEAVPVVYEETPPFESMSADGKGNGKSATSTDYNNSKSGYGYSRSGGGGGSYVQDIYSHDENVYAPSPKISYADRPQRSNLDYLRPSFETKGSREAYKREDF